VPRPPAARARGIIAALLVVVGFVLTPLGVIGFWSHQTLTDTQRYLDTVGPIGDDAATKAAIAEFITDKIEAKVDPDELVREIFGDLIERYPRLELMVPIVAGAVDSVITDTVDRLVYSEKFDEIWRGLNLAAQKSIILILEGESAGPVKLQGDQIVLDIGDLLEVIKQRLIERGLTFLENVDFPEIDRQIVLLNAPQLAQVRTIYSVTSPILQWTILGVILAFLAAAIIAVRRPRVTAWIGAGLAFWAVVLAIALAIGERVFVNQLAGTPFGPASEVFYSTLLRYLTNSVSALILIGVGLWIVGIYLGNTRGGRAVRAAVQALSEKVAGAVPHGPLDSTGAWVERNGRWLRGILAALLLVAVLVGGQLTVLRTLVWTLVALVVLAIIEVLAAVPASRRAELPPPTPVPGAPTTS
jgi:hypothetical protein